MSPNRAYNDLPKSTMTTDATKLMKRSSKKHRDLICHMVVLTESFSKEHQELRCYMFVLTPLGCLEGLTMKP